MFVFTDDIGFAGKVYDGIYNWQGITKSAYADNIGILLDRIYPDRNIYRGEIESGLIWNYLFIVKYAPGSHYDLLINLSQEYSDMPDGILCLADSGGGFHGFKNRLWVTSPGNIHLSAFLSPHRNIEHFHVGFPVLSAISVVQTIDTIEDLKNIAGIKWVNDILIENSKVGGVLAHTQPQGDIVTGVVLGFGVNVETTPKTIPTPFVPKSASLLDFASNPERCSQRLVFNHLIKYLDKNYRLLLGGRYGDLIDFYRERSVIVGKKVKVQPDTDEKEIKETVEGKVTGIGDNLELFIHGRDKPVYSGRLIFNN